MPVTFSEVSTTTFPQPAAGGRMTFIDVDGDGDLDILYQTGANGTAFQYGRANGDGAYSLFALGSSPFAGISLPDHNGGNYHVGDIDGDGDMDLWAGQTTGAGTGLYLRNDGGAFSSQSSATFPAPLASSRSVMGDFDNDGDADILYQTGGNGTAFQYARSNGDGTYTILSQASSPFAGLSLLDNGGGTHFTGDFDGDGDLDVYATAAGATGAFYRNDNGAFTSPSTATFPAALAITRYVVGDFDSDGDDDILYQTGGDGTAWQYGRSNGDGTLTILSQGDSPFAGVSLVNHNGSNFVAADVDGDGDDDLVGTSNGTTGEFYLAAGKPPEISSSTPSDNGTGVTVGANISLTFDESVSKGSGNIYLYRGDGVLIETISVGSAQVTGSGATWTIDPSVTLAGLTNYYVLTDDGVFVDADGSIFFGVEDSATLNFTTAAVNTAPTFTNLDGDVASFVENQVVLLDVGRNATVSDSDSADFDGGSLTVSLTANKVAGEDILAIANFGNGPGAIGVSGSTIAYEGVEIGTFTGGTGGADLVVTFGPAASPAAVQALVHALIYNNTSESPETSTRTVQVVLTDGDGGTSLTQTAAVTVTSVNDAPAVINGGVVVLPAEDEDVTDPAGAAVSALFGGSFSDADGDAFAGIMIGLNNADASQGVWQVFTGGVWSDLPPLSPTDTYLVSPSDSLRFLPASDYNGTPGSLVILLIDGSAGPVTTGMRVDASVTGVGGTTPYSTSSLTLQTTINAVAEPAAAVDDANSVTETGTVSGSVFGNDSDPDGPALTVSGVNGSTAGVGTQITLPSGALLTLNADGTYTYDPNGVFADLAGPGSGATNTSAIDSFTYTLTGGGTATVTVTINGENNPGDPLEGSAGADTLGRGPGGGIGGTGANDMAGGAGDDFYAVDDVGDSIVEDVAEGARDRVFASVSYALTAGAAIEMMSTDNHAGTDDIDLTGNAFDQLVQGNAGNNVLDGGGGTDWLVGGFGDDVYILDGSSDRISETAGQGADTARTSASYRLAAGISVETLTTTDAAGTTAINLTGNELANAVIGNAGANLLDGGAGADTLTGGLGDDIYGVDQGGDVIVEADGLGYDRVLASASYTLADGVSVESLSTNNHTGTQTIDLTGNDLDQLVFGNAGANRLDGGGGDDVIRGNGGADALFGGQGGDVLYGDAGSDTLSGGQGDDQILGGADFDTVLLTGDAADYFVLPLADGRWRVADMVSGRDGVDVLTGVEQLQFADGFLALIEDAAPPAPLKDTGEALILPGAGEDPFFIAGVRLHDGWSDGWGG